MAGTDKNSITATGWRSASDELAFVRALVGAEARALEVMDALRDDLAKGLIRWDCDRDKFGVDGDFQAYPSLRTTFAAAIGHAFLWRRDEQSRLDVDWSTSWVAWVGPLAGFSSDGRGNSWPSFDPYASTSLTASGVRFHHGDVGNRLVGRGIMPRPSVPPSSSPPPEPTPTAQLVEAALASPPSSSPSAMLTEEPEDKTTSASELSFPTLQMLGVKGWQQEAIWEAASDLYSGGLPEKLGAAAWYRKITKGGNEQARKRSNKPPQRHPSEDSCRRFLKAYREWRAKQRDN